MPKLILPQSVGAKDCFVLLYIVFRKSMISGLINEIELLSHRKTRMLNNLHSFTMIVANCEYISTGRYISTRTIEFEARMQDIAFLKKSMLISQKRNRILLHRNEVIFFINP